MGDLRKTDMERVGVFQEMGYVTIGDKYKGGAESQFNAAAGKGKQMLPGGSKTRSALQSGYFENKFGRIMESEAYTDPIKIRRQHRQNEAKRNLTNAFLPSSGEKWPSGVGSHYGTFGGPVPSLSPTKRASTSAQESKRNFLTNPGKRGTGYGYLRVTMGDYHKHMSDPFDGHREISRRELEVHKNALKGGAFRLNMHPKAFFDQNPYASDKALTTKKSDTSAKQEIKPFKPSSPGKQPGGMKAGTFDGYPSHSTDPYKVLKYSRAINIVNKSGKTFIPSPGPKSIPTGSIINQNIHKTLNSQNYRSYTTMAAV